MKQLLKSFWKIISTKTAKVLIVLIVVGIGGVYAYRAGWDYYKQPTGTKSSVIELKVQNINELSSLMLKKDLIKSEWVFKKLWGNASMPGEGLYELSGQEPARLIETLQAGPNTVKVTFPEGFSAMQFAQRLTKNGIDGAKFYEMAAPLEGKLFPDTYYLPLHGAMNLIIKQFTDNYEAKTQTLKLTDEQLIIASIVEREAIADDERLKIATVYYNRLKIGMKMQADPTVQYARDIANFSTATMDTFAAWEPLQATDLKFNSPYNTYVKSGNIPAPICNPGLPSIVAATQPIVGFEALFFFHDKDQKVHFSNTAAEHQAAINEYGLSQ